MVHTGGKRQIQRGEGGEKWAEVGGLLVISGLGDVQAWTAAEGHVYVPASSANMVCVDVHSSSYY